MTNNPVNSHHKIDSKELRNIDNELKKITEIYSNFKKIKLNF